MMNWINVKQTPMPKNTEVLVRAGKYRAVVKYSTALGWLDSESISSQAWVFKFELEDITHWMPLNKEVKND